MLTLGRLLSPLTTRIIIGARLPILFGRTRPDLLAGAEWSATAAPNRLRGSLLDRDLARRFVGGGKCLMDLSPDGFADHQGNGRMLG